MHESCPEDRHEVGAADAIELNGEPRKRASIGKVVVIEGSAAFHRLIEACMVGK